MNENLADLAKVDDDGYFSIVDRKKEMIRVWLLDELPETPTAKILTREIQPPAPIGTAAPTGGQPR